MALGLNDDLVEPKRVLLDYAVQTAVMAVGRQAGAFWVRASVAHGGEHLEDDALKAQWVDHAKTLKDVCSDVILHLLVGGLEPLFWRRRLVDDRFCGL